jgi:hypothetical protein
VICADLVSLIFSRHFRVQRSILCRWVWIFIEAVIGFEWTSHMPKHFSFLWTPKFQHLQVKVTVLWQGHEFSVPHPHPQLINFWTTEMTFIKPCMKITPLESTPSATFWNYTVSNTNSVEAQNYAFGRQQHLLPQGH